VSEPPDPAVPARPPPPDPKVTAGLEGDWQRLHPLSPLVRGGRGLIPLAAVLLISGAGSGRGSLGNDLGHVALVLVLFGVGLISWLVTRWRVEGGVLRWTAA
jgi:hypothetical protein